MRGGRGDNAARGPVAAGLPATRLLSMVRELPGKLALHRTSCREDRWVAPVACRAIRSHSALRRGCAAIVKAQVGAVRRRGFDCQLARHVAARRAGVRQARRRIQPWPAKVTRLNTGSAGRLPEYRDTFNWPGSGRCDARGRFQEDVMSRFTRGGSLSSAERRSR